MTRLIDADALYMELVKMKDFGELTAKKAIRVVEKAPTVDAEPVRHGKWVDDAMGVLRCSECNTQAPWKYGRDFIDYRWESNYCPNCGADMRGEE